MIRQQVGIGFRQDVLQRAQHQGERRTEFVTHVREERRLRAIYLGQGIGAPPLPLVCVGVGKPGRDLAGDEINEAEIGFVQAPIWVDPGNQKAGRRVLTLARDRREHGIARRPIPRADRDPIEISAPGHRR